MEQKQRNYVQDLKAWDLLRLEELEIKLVDELMAAKPRVTYFDREHLGEELLRQIAKYRIPRGDEKALKEIPLLDEGDRATKFPLGSLVRFRDDSVDDVLRWSVHAYYERQTFNKVADIKEVLSRSRVDDAAVRHLYPEIANFIIRRHTIVHRADRGSVKAGAIGHGPVMNINSRTVARWATVSDQFANKILRQFLGGRRLRKW